MNTTLKLADGKFSLEMQTYGSGEPLLFIHGAGGLMPVEPFLEDLGKQFKVYAPQFPGYGESTGNEHIDDIADAVLFYHELMDELGIPTANIVGHSMGGMPAAQMMTAIPTDFKELETMYVERVKRLATASKFLWPIPDRGLKKRAYRIKAPTLLLWGDDDKLIPPAYAKEFTSRIKNSKLELIKDAGHMVMYEQQEALVGAIRKFLK